MGKASRRKQQRRTERQADQAAASELRTVVLPAFQQAHANMTIFEMWHRIGLPQTALDPDWRDLAMLTVMDWIGTSEEDLAAVLRAAQFDWLFNPALFVNFTQTAVARGHLTPKGLAANEDVTQRFLADPASAARVAETERRLGLQP